jgi:hypothetical protein
MPTVIVSGNTVTITGTGITRVLITKRPGGEVVVDDPANNSPYTLNDGDYRVAVTHAKGTDNFDITVPTIPPP